MSYCYNLLYVPMSIAFEFEASDSLKYMILDALALLIYLLDLYMQIN